MSEASWDKKLNIATVGIDDSRADAFRYPYEPTPYSVLERIADSGFLDENSVVVDYGCGKGRVGFFLNRQLGCKAIGIEYDERIFAQAMENLRNYRGEGISLLNTRAEDYEPREADSFYFFNPFSVEILRAVLQNILESYYESPREIQLFFYFPSDEYLGELMTNDALMFVDEIDCSDLFPNNRQRERVLVFEVEG